MAYVKKDKPFDWTEAIIKVLAEEGKPMHYTDITEKIIREGYYCVDANKTPESSVNMYLSTQPKLFEKVDRKSVV